MNYLVGLIVIVVGALLVIKANWFLANFGSIDWAERHLGAEGGTRLFYKLIGIFAILGTFLALSGVLGTIVRSVFSFANF